MRCQCPTPCRAVFAYAPNTAQYTSIANSAMSNLQANFLGPILSLQGFSSKDSLFSAIQDVNFSACSNVVLSAIFDTAGGYQILISDSDVSISSKQYSSQTCRAAWGSVDPDTGSRSSPYPASSDCPTMRYFDSLFIAAQVAIDSSLYSAVFNPKFYVAPLPAYQQFLGQDSTSIVPIYLAIGLSFFGSRFCIQVIAEKERKIRDGMRMMGCSSHVYYFSWIFSTLLAQLPIVVIYFIALVVAKIIYQSNAFLLFITLALYVLSQTAKYIILLCTSFFCNTLFSFLTMCDFVTTSQRGSVVSFCLGSIPALFGLIPGLTAPLVIALSLFFPTFALTSAFSVFVAFETGFNGIQTGVSVENISTLGPNQVSLLQLLIVLICSTAIDIPLHFYLEKVLPSASASPLSPLFFLSAAYWSAAPPIENNSQSVPASDKYEATEGQPCVCIRGLTKSFVKNGTAAGLCGGQAVVFKAVDGLNLDLFEGEIFCLLGHNGAGKSTTIAMLTSLISIDEGDATLFGSSVRSQSDLVMRSMGVCLQQNILLDELTVEEHMRLFAAIRSVPSSDVEASVTELLTSVNLNAHRSQMSLTLSGGQKRRLCTAMAFLGNPKIVFLDEPTTGLDPSARRSLWTFLKQRRAGRVIVLTTHFMDEADLLADRKGIIVDGRLAVCGSSPFLKNKFGLGYNLSLSLKSAFSSSHVERLLDLVRSFVPEASARETSGDRTISLPMASLPHIPELLDALDTQGKQFGLESYGLNTTTLEQAIITNKSPPITLCDYVEAGLHVFC
jgi:ABC-type multidrug transport system ATPase subunit